MVGGMVGGMVIRGRRILGVLRTIGGVGIGGAFINTGVIGGCFINTGVLVGELGSGVEVGTIEPHDIIKRANPNIIASINRLLMSSTSFFGGRCAIR